MFIEHIPGVSTETLIVEYHVIQPLFSACGHFPLIRLGMDAYLLLAAADKQARVAKFSLSSYKLQ